MSLLYIYKHEDPKTFHMFGLLYPSPYKLGNDPRLFVTKVQYSGTNLVSHKTTILDPQNIGLNYPYYKKHALIRQLVTSDNKLIISTFQRDLSGTNKGFVVKVDENLNKLWELNLQFGSGNTIPKSIAECADGNYLVCGLCNIIAKNIEQPFACKISKDGSLLWKKLYNMTKNGSFSSGYQTDNNYFFGGTTNSFGSGLNLDDIFLMKTDIEGNLK